MSSSDSTQRHEVCVVWSAARFDHMLENSCISFLNLVQLGHDTFPRLVSMRCNAGTIHSGIRNDNIY